MFASRLVDFVGFATSRMQESLKENIEGFVRESICLFKEFSLIPTFSRSYILLDGVLQ